MIRTESTVSHISFRDIRNLAIEIDFQGLKYPNLLLSPDSTPYPPNNRVPLHLHISLTNIVHLTGFMQDVNIPNIRFIKGTTTTYTKKEVLKASKRDTKPTFDI